MYINNIHISYIYIYICVFVHIGEGHSHPLQYSCLENSHGQRNLMGYSPWGHKELDMTERLSTYVYVCVCLYSCSVTQSCLTLCHPMDCSTPGFPVLHHLLELAERHVHCMQPCNHLILCCPLLLLPSIFPSIRVFSNESVLHNRWPKYRTFSFSISPSNSGCFI